MSKDEADEALKSTLMGLLEGYGFAMTPIRSSPTHRSPDFMGGKEGDDFVFELKERTDDPEALREERDRLKGGEVVGSFEPMGPNPRVFEKARDGVKQLLTHPKQEAFRLLWLHAGGRDPETQVEQFRATLYGTTQIFELGCPHLTRCHYFLDSEFFRHRESLSGAVLTTPSSLQICLNTLSHRIAEFRESSLIRTFHNALLDPEKLEREGAIYVVDCAHDRKNKQAVLEYLQAKYGKTQLMDMQLSMTTARIAIPIQKEKL